MTNRTISNAATLRGWRKSSYSNDQGGSCLEVLDSYPSGIPVRDSKIPHGPALLFTTTNWATFISAIKNAELLT